MALGMVLSTHPGCIVSVSARFEDGGQVGSPKRKRRRSSPYRTVTEHVRRRYEFTKAAALQDALPYTEPPYWYYPVQSLGAALLQAGRVPEAEAQFRSALKQAPANGWSYFGLAQALRARGDEAGMRQIESALAKTWVGNRDLLQLPRL